MKSIGLAGLGFIGKAHFHAYQKMNHCRVDAIYTRSEVTDDAVREQFQGTFFSDYDEMLNSPDLDIIDICVPTYLHEEYIIKAANAGKHIICEKPLTLTEASANRIVDAVKENEVELFVGHTLRFWPEYAAIKSYSQSHPFELVHARRLGQFPSWSSWFKEPDKSGGALFDLHIHDIDFVYYLLGEVESVYAVGSRNEHGAWSHIMTTLVFKNKTKTFVEASHQMPDGYPFTMNMRVQSKEETLEYFQAAGENIEAANEESGQLILYKAYEKILIDTETADPFYKELSYFVNCIENNTENELVPLDDVRYVLKLLHAIKTSLENGKLVYM
ncbi:Gfo/Idh/MocA family protein [Lentibacillus sediminis]|uniref:Gfo/Idh/MocA family protein n=1 Tax=Lentibacillus sediminis TaxID=1940529 RepID=UPI000C1C3105|nr:Gfo/Idh/MocA family oxidoreductase [Lentibacillus sediminis]